MKIRDRIRELRRVKASDLLPNPKNFRLHPIEQQSAMKGLLQEIGFADALIAREVGDGRLMLLDGHLRVDVSGDGTVPVLVVDLDEDEADKVLATLDPLAAMAKTNQEMLDELIRGVSTESEGVAAMLGGLKSKTADTEEVVKELKVSTPPVMAWVLIGIPVVRYGEIMADVERIANIEGVVCETTANDG